MTQVVKREIGNASFPARRGGRLVNIGVSRSRLRICKNILRPEAKKEDRLGKSKREEIKTIEGYDRMAAQIGADALVFATFAHKWSEPTEKYIRNTIRNREVILISRTELLGT